MKSCSRCGSAENIYSSGWCKECVKESSAKSKRTKNGVVNVIYSSQKQTSKKRGMIKPSCTKQELKEWLFSQELFHVLYSDWVNSDYDRYLKPSIDRLNDYSHYCFSNIQLTTWGENDNKGHKSAIDGSNNKQSKAVIKQTLEGINICEYYSMSEAGRDCKISFKDISNAVIKSKTAGVFRWILKRKET